MTARTVLVTGGSRGIGLACARAFETDGHRVAITYVSKPVDDLFSVRCDVSHRVQVEDAVAAVEERFGPVEVLVCSAGITRDALLVRMTDDDFDAVLQTNLTGAWRMAKRVVPSMMRARWGRVVLLSSVGAYMGGPGQSNYAASKAGMIGLARSIAREYAGRGITANVVAPGPIDTDMLRALDDAKRAALAQRVPVGRIGEPHEVAGLVRFLSSDEAGFITGAVIPVDGGLGMGD
jgi:3-oxoacyl-[acyl-carrier protein] reductase